MNLPIIGTIIGAVSAAIITAIFININNIKAQNRKLKEEHYLNYIKGLHCLAANNSDSTALSNYTLYRDQLFIIASPNVISALLKYENNTVGTPVENKIHDELLDRVQLSSQK
jgi:hypothetical protein